MGLGWSTSPPAVEVTVKGAMSLTQTHCSLPLISNLIIRNLLVAESASETLLLEPILKEETPFGSNLLGVMT